MPEHPRIEELRRRVQRDPASIAFAQLAEEFRRSGQHVDAVDTARSGLEIHPGYLSARVTLARALTELGQLSEARDEFQTVLAAAPDNLAALRGLAEAHQRQGALSQALAFYRRAFGLAPNDPDLERAVGDLTREVARIEPPGDELLTLDQLTRELERHAAAHPVTAATRPPVSVAQPMPTERDTFQEGAPRPPLVEHVSDLEAARRRDLRTLARLEQWLTAIHGARAERRA